MRYYEFTFENGATYVGSAADKNEFVRHLTKKEKSEMGKIVAKRSISNDEREAYERRVEEFLLWV